MFGWLRAPKTQEDIAVLLSGPSLAKLADHIEDMRGKRVAYYAINRKRAIEERILSRIGRKIDVWVIMSPMEFEAQFDEVHAFLNDPDTSNFVVSSIALKASKELLDKRPLPHPEKIMLADEWLFKAFDFYYRHTQNKPLTSMDEIKGELNTVFVLLSGLLTAPIARTVYLFGCDGMPAPDREVGPNYFASEHYDAKRLEYSNLYGDMQRFEQYWRPYSKTLGLKGEAVFNVNPDSYYKCLPRITLAKAIERIR